MTRKASPTKPRPRADEAGIDLKMVELLHGALAQHKAGALEAAEAMYREVLDHHPDNPDALHLLGALCKQKGDNDAALRLIARAIEISPANPHFHANFGIALQAAGRSDEAIVHYRKAIEFNPMDAAAFGNLGNALTDLGRADEAIECYRSALRFDPKPRAVHKNLGKHYVDTGRPDEAEALLGQYLAVYPDDAEANNNYAYALEQRGADAEAEIHYRRAHDGAPESAEITSNLGNILKKLNRLDEADACYREALRRKPKDPRITANRAAALMAQSRQDEATALLLELIEMEPDNPAAHNDLALCLAAAGRLVEACTHFARAAELDETQTDYLFNLGTAMIGRDMYPEAIAAFRAVLRIQPRAVKAHANLCQTLKLKGQLDEANMYAHATLMLEGWKPDMFPALSPTFSATCDLDGIDALGDMLGECEKVNPETLLGAFLNQLNLIEDEADCRRFAALHRKWGDAVLAKAARAPLPAAAGGGSGKIRVGILSADLRSHAVAKFLKPWLWNFDRGRFEIFCYSPVALPSDPQQAAIRDQVSAFRMVANMSDRDVAAAIRADNVDVLFELNGATHNGRLQALAYKPAPIQITWLGYPFTSGLATVDYALHDRFVRPTVADLWVEKSVDMKDSWVAFSDFPDEPIAGTPPLDRFGYVTFGTMNAVYKFTRPIFALWARVLKAVPGSKFLVARPELSSRIALANISKAFAEHGIGPERLMVIANDIGQFGHFQYYNDIDITLDTYPVVGGTTTCDALWMGVPVIGRYGISTHQRVNHAILNHCGLGEYSVATEDAYVEQAVKLAGDPRTIRSMRRYLRETVMRSPLCDSVGFARNMEDLLTSLVRRHGLR